MSNSALRPFSTPSSQPTQPQSQPQSQQQRDLTTILTRPTWSVRSLLPQPQPQPPTSTHTQPPQQPTIPASTLSHLLRLSSLPQPSTPDQQASMLETLHTQLHFVRAIQAVDTSGVAPLRAIRDETCAGQEENTITLDTLRGVLGQEEAMGFRKRPRRVPTSGALNGQDGADEGKLEEALVEAATRDRRERGYYLVHKGSAKGAE
ncbi:hypothetical protein BD289DRAFT_450298 [Coniella lustricola]|uniref:Glutamyl-tRNA amidotransferase complex subunit Gta3 domain-containing protein n=1 Tax=Coniella lustricola TaxID=2025994 RepID=A0A2T3AJ62_9PEZI|nr:hypothetical protein BD289DRAFT_450298 [Coniella lustricola]